MIKMFFSWKSKQFHRDLKHCVSADDLSQFGPLVQRGASGLVPWSDWAASGGEILENNHGQGRGMVSASQLQTLEPVRKACAMALGRPVNLGIGPSLSKAEEALLWATKNNRTMAFWTPFMQAQQPKEAVAEPKEAEVELQAQVDATPIPSLDPDLGPNQPTTKSGGIADLSKKIATLIKKLG